MTTASDITIPRPRQSVLTPGITAVKKFWRPFLLLQATAAAMVIAYYHDQQVRHLCEHLSRMKETGGLLFDMASAAIARALLPEIAKAIMGGGGVWHKGHLRDVLFAVFVFAANGIRTDIESGVLTAAFGDGHRLGTVGKKVLADQVIYTPLIGTPYWLLTYSL